MASVIGHQIAVEAELEVILRQYAERCLVDGCMPLSITIIFHANYTDCYTIQTAILMLKLKCLRSLALAETLLYKSLNVLAQL